MNIELSEQIKTYINVNGLPKENILLIEFLIPNDFYKTTYNSEEYIVIAIEDDLNGVGMNEKGKIFILDEESPIYVSNSFIQFVKLLSIYKSLPELPVNCSEKELHQQAKTLKTAIKEIDNSALKKPDFFWSLIVEQVSDGLL